ncbi:MAG: ABC transporter permease [Granulosicoccaceae bacterium]
MSQRKSAPLALWFLSIGALIVLWFLCAWYAQSRALPNPLQVANAIMAEARTGELFFHLGATLARVVAAFVLAMTIGSVIGIVLGRSDTLNMIFDPWVILFLNIPALVVIVLSYIWFGLNEVTAVVAVAVNKIPNVIVTIREGAKSLEPQFAEMAQVFHFSKWKLMRHVVIPQLQPYFAGATRSGIALIWKIVLVVELLGRSNGVGFQIHLYFQLFDVATILAYTLVFVAVMLLVEYLLLQPLEKYSRRWRGSHA